MTTIKNFEELDCWKKARELAGNIYELTRKEKFSHDFGLRDQIQRAAGSICTTSPKDLNQAMIQSLSVS
jgi:hypothetical protein